MLKYCLGKSQRYYSIIVYVNVKKYCNAVDTQCTQETKYFCL
jgi:hypothetical protein